MKVALVTGVSYGLGLSIAERLLELGFKVYGISRSRPNLESSQFEWIGADLTNKARLQAIAQSLKVKTIDVLINNAGTAFEEEAFDFSDAKFKRMFDLNFVAPIKLTSLLAQKLKGGLVINISSVSDRSVGEGDGLYSASKAALNAYFDAVVEENHSIKVISVLPSYIDTPLQHKLSGDLKDFSWEECMSSSEVANSVIYLIKNVQKLKSGTRVIVVNDALMEDTEDPEKLWYYNVTTDTFKRLKH